VVFPTNVKFVWEMAKLNVGDVKVLVTLQNGENN